MSAQSAATDGLSIEPQLCVNDVIQDESGSRKYLALQLLGQGTYGYAIKAQDLITRMQVVIKIIKYKKAHKLEQTGRNEVQNLLKINKHLHPHEQHHFPRLYDYFNWFPERGRPHYCIIMELMSMSLCDLLTKNFHKGLSLSVVKEMAAQLLDALEILARNRLIHCDIKPENVLLAREVGINVKLIDFGGARHQQSGEATTSIQTIFYRAPEIMLEHSTTPAIDMWSLGCLLAELFLGIPLFAGYNEFDIMRMIIKWIGYPSREMICDSKRTHIFFNRYVDGHSRQPFLVFIDRQKYLANNPKANPRTRRRLLEGHSLYDFIMYHPHNLPLDTDSQEIGEEIDRREIFLDFLRGVLQVDPSNRLTPTQAKSHPFITGSNFLSFTTPPPRRPASLLPTRTPSVLTEISLIQPSHDIPPPNARSLTDVYHSHISHNQQYAQLFNRRSPILDDAREPPPTLPTYFPAAAMSQNSGTSLYIARRSTNSSLPGQVGFRAFHALPRPSAPAWEANRSERVSSAPRHPVYYRA